MEFSIATEYVRDRELVFDALRTAGSAPLGSAQASRELEDAAPCTFISSGRWVIGNPAENPGRLRQDSAGVYPV